MPVTVKIAPNPTQEQSFVIPDANERSAGVMSSLLYLKLKALPDEGSFLRLLQPELLSYEEAEASIRPVVTKYARPSGSDTTGDGTLAAPYLTWQRAVKDAPWVPAGKRFRIDVTGLSIADEDAQALPPLQGSRVPAGFDNLSSFGLYQQADLEIYAEPTVVGTWAASEYSVAQESASGAAQLSTLTIPGATFTVNEHAGHFVRFPGASGAATVISNTADTLYIAMPILYADYYSTFPLELCAQSCTVDISSIDHWLAGHVNYTVTLAGLAFTQGAYSAVDSDLCAPRLSVIGCKNYAAFNNSSYALNVRASSLVNYLQHTQGKMDLAFSSGVNLNVCATSANGIFGVLACHFTGGDSIGEGYYHGYSTDSGSPRYVACFYTVHRDTSRGGLRLLGMNQWVTLGYCHFENCGYGGVRLEWGAKAYVNGPVSGTGNGAGVGGAGWYVIDDSHMQVATTDESGTTLDASNMTMTGTVSQLVVGDNDAITMTQFFAARVAEDAGRTDARVFQRGTKIRQAPIAPQLTSTQRDALPNLVAGTMIYNTTTSKGQMYDGSVWRDLW